MQTDKSFLFVTHDIVAQYCLCPFYPLLYSVARKNFIRLDHVSYLGFYAVPVHLKKKLYVCMHIQINVKW